MNIVNLTPHTLNIVTPEEGTINVEPSGLVARVSVTSVEGDPVDGIPVAMTSYGEVEGLPAPTEDTIFVVSGMVEAQISRSDVYSPGPLLRDEAGKPVGCEGLKQTL